MPLFMSPFLSRKALFSFIDVLSHNNSIGKFVPPFFFPFGLLILSYIDCIESVSFVSNSISLSLSFVKLNAPQTPYMIVTLENFIYLKNSRALRFGISSPNNSSPTRICASNSFAPLNLSHGLLWCLCRGRDCLIFLHSCENLTTLVGQLGYLNQYFFI